MRISSLIRGDRSLVQQASQAAKEKSAGRAGQAKTGSQDRVALSDSATNLASAIREMVAQMKVEGVHSLSRLEELREAIRAGEYDLDPTALAEAILEEDG